MEGSRSDRRDLWILTSPEGRRVGLVASDASLPIALTRLPRNWDLTRRHEDGDGSPLDAMVVSVGTGDDPRGALDAVVDPSLIGWGEGPTEARGPVHFLPRSAGLEELADAIDRACDTPPPREATFGERDLADVRSGTPDPPDHGRGLPARRERFRDRIVERLFEEPRAQTPTDDAEGSNGHVTPTSRVTPRPLRDAPLAVRVEQLGRAMPDLVRLLTEVPVLRSEEQVLARLLDVCASQLSVDTLAVWRPTGDGWISTIHRGFDAGSDALRVPADQPLLSVLDTEGGSLLIHSAGVRAEFLAGLPGSGPGSILGAALAIPGERYGLLTASRAVPLEEEDVGWLQGVVDEAMAGLAIAAAVARMSAPPEPGIT